MSEKKANGVNLMDTFIKNQAKEKSAYPEVKPGSVIKIHQRFVEVISQTKSKKQAKAKEAEKIKERIQIFEGTVISRHGKSFSSTITVRKISDGIGTEYVLPLDMPSIKKIEVLKQSKVRKAKLYYLRGRTGKALRLKDSATGPIKKVKKSGEKKTKESI